jgi:arabinogalactan oligomer / maltooligosaccharide transport system permease protein
MNRTHSRRSATKMGASILKHVFLIIMALISVYPVLWVIAIAFSAGESLGSPILAFGIIPIPSSFTLDHFSSILSVQVVGSGFPVWVKNSALITISSVVGAVALTLPAGYAFSRRRFRGQEASMFSFLLPTMFPGVVTIIPQFLVFTTLGLVNTYYAVIIPYMVGSLSLSVFIMKSAFDSIPREIDEAAMLDGAGEFRIFSRMLLPLTLPSVATVALWAFMGSWLDWALAHVMLENNALWTLPLALYAFLQSNYSYYGSFSALALVMAVPVFVVFVVFQKYLVTGLTAGSVKG